LEYIENITKNITAFRRYKFFPTLLPTVSAETVASSLELKSILNSFLSESREKLAKWARLQRAVEIGWRTWGKGFLHN